MFSLFQSQADLSQRVVGSNPSAGKKIYFLMETPLKYTRMTLLLWNMYIKRVRLYHVFIISCDYVAAVDKKVTQKWSSMIGFHLIGYIIKNKATSKIFTQGNFLHFLTK